MVNQNYKETILNYSIKKWWKEYDNNEAISNKNQKNELKIDNKETFIIKKKNSINNK